MSRHEVTVLRDDLGGEGEAFEVTFEVDDQDYTLDLNESHADELEAVLVTYDEALTQARTARDDALARFVAAASEPSRVRLTRKASRRLAQEVRTWAEANSVPVSARGPVGAEVIAAYRAAHGGHAPIPRTHLERRASSRGLDAGSVRQWCRDNGVPVSARGPLSRDALDSFRAAHPDLEVVDNSGELDLSAVRSWAQGRGIKVSSRGPVAASVIEQYQGAH